MPDEVYFSFLEWVNRVKKIHSAVEYDSWDWWEEQEKERQEDIKRHPLFHWKETCKPIPTKFEWQFTMPTTTSDDTSDVGKWYDFIITTN